MDEHEEFMQRIAHAFGIPPWVGDIENEWPRRRRVAWRIRHPRRWWRVLSESWKARNEDGQTTIAPQGADVDLRDRPDGDAA